MIAVIDYGMGNLRSVQKALEKNGAEAIVTQETDVIRQADKIVLPGVGAMQPAMDKLNSLGIVGTIAESVQSGKPFLGICLGYQLLFDRSNEGGEVKGLGLLKGSVERFASLKVPHMGWNQLDVTKTDCPLFQDLANPANVYFCHSYYVKPADDNIIATTTSYGIDFASSVWKDNIFAVQFHPEKSQAIGLKVLENFVKL